MLACRYQVARLSLKKRPSAFFSRRLKTGRCVFTYETGATIITGRTQGRANKGFTGFFIVYRGTGPSRSYACVHINFY